MTKSKQPRLVATSNTVHRADLRFVTMTVYNQTDEVLPVGFSTEAFEVYPHKADRVGVFELQEPLPPGRSASKTVQWGWLGPESFPLVLVPFSAGDDVSYEGDLVFRDAVHAQASRRAAIESGLRPSLMFVDEHTVRLEGTGQTLTPGVRAAVAKLAQSALHGSVCCTAKTGPPFRVDTAEG